MTQPEALRLAEWIESDMTCDGDEKIVAELRRLHDLAMEQQGKIYALEMARSMEQKTAKLKRDALLMALRWIATVNAMDYEYQKVARAAIKALEENT